MCRSFPRQLPRVNEHGAGVRGGVRYDQQGYGGDTICGDIRITEASCTGAQYDQRPILPLPITYGEYARSWRNGVECGQTR